MKIFNLKFKLFDKYIAIIFTVTLFILLNSSCSKEDAPSYTRVSINKVTILNFPDNDGGLTWDNALEGYDPDVYFKMTNAGTSTVIYDAGSGNRAQNMTLSSLPFSWYNTNGSAIYTSNISQSIDLDLYDYDIASSDQYMGTATFNFTNYSSGSNKYPSSITVTNGSVSIQLELSWLP